MSIRHRLLGRASAENRSRPSLPGQPAHHNPVMHDLRLSASPLHQGAAPSVTHRPIAPMSSHSLSLLNTHRHHTSPPVCHPGVYLCHHTSPGAGLPGVPGGAPGGGGAAGGAAGGQGGGAGGGPGRIWAGGGHRGGGQGGGRTGGKEERWGRRRRREGGREGDEALAGLWTSGGCGVVLCVWGGGGDGGAEGGREGERGDRDTHTRTHKHPHPPPHTPAHPPTQTQAIDKLDSPRTHLPLLIRLCFLPLPNPHPLNPLTPPPPPPHPPTHPHKHRP